MIFWTADLHFGHANILKHQVQRAGAFKDIVEMEDHFITNINKLVLPNDELWVLGDFVWKASRVGHFRQRLKVRKLHIVQGNHDVPSLRNHVSSFDSMVYRRFGNLHFHLTHYPMASWRGRFAAKSIHLYGHSHGTLEDTLSITFPGRRSMDVGIDNAFKILGEWRPFSMDEVLRLLGVQNA
jgi:calcineurin-like phosphoesterase family protein